MGDPWKAKKKLDKLLCAIRRRLILRIVYRGDKCSDIRKGTEDTRGEDGTGREMRMRGGWRR
jgi:hypothetical protein